MRIFFKKNKKEGFMMVEILVAVAIIVTIVMVMMSVVQKGISISHQSLHTTQAAFLLEEGAEAVRIVRDNNWTNISSLSGAMDINYYPTFTGGTWTLSTTPNQVGSFTRIVNVLTVNRDVNGDISDGGLLDAGTRLINVSVSWPEEGQTISKSLSFYISNIFQ